MLTSRSQMTERVKPNSHDINKPDHKDRYSGLGTLYTSHYKIINKSTSRQIQYRYSMT